MSRRRIVFVEIFKESGKFYTEGEFELADGVEVWNICKTINAMPNLPGLRSSYQTWPGYYVARLGDDGVPRHQKCLGARE